MSDDDGYFGDVIYEVWRRGGNPDRVDADRVDDYRYDGVDADSAASAELRRQRPPEPQPGLEDFE